MEAKLDLTELVDASVGPRGSLEMLSQSEIDALLDRGQGGIHSLFRKCALAILNSGSDSDNAKELFERYRDFEVQLVRHPWGIRLEIRNAPAGAFVDGQMIRGIKEHLFAVLRDVVYIAHEIEQGSRFDLTKSVDITNAVFHVLRNAGVLDRKIKPNLVVCWGGHSIGESEYQYTKRVGYELGLRGLDVCTGCGPGAMKGPMKGATIGHAKQRIGSGRYIGLTEPGIIAAEPPNAIVNQLVIMPDIEKRLEAFVRLAHGVVVFPGGVGTAEEVLYLLGILLDPRNESQHLPVVLTGPTSSAPYFQQIQSFLTAAIGPEAVERLRFVVGDPAPWPGAWSRTSRACGPVAAPATIPTPTTGCSPCRRISSIPSRSRMKACGACSCIVTSPATCWSPTCGGPSPASSPAMSRRKASAPSRSTGPSRYQGSPADAPAGRAAAGLRGPGPHEAAR